MTVRDCPRPLPDPSATLACDCGWRHLLLGLTGKATFFIVNLLPLPALREWNTAGTWLFMPAQVRCWAARWGSDR